MITSTGLDLSDLRTGHDFFSAMLDTEAWEALMEDRRPACHQSQDTTGETPALQNNPPQSPKHNRPRR